MKNWNNITFGIVGALTIFVLCMGTATAINNYELDSKLVEAQDCIYLNTYLPSIPPSEGIAALPFVKVLNSFKPKGFRPAADKQEVSWLLSHRCTEVQTFTRNNKTIFIIEDYGSCKLNASDYNKKLVQLGKCYAELPKFVCRNSGCGSSGWHKAKVSEPMMGDFDGDGELTETDYQAMMDMLLEKVPPHGNFDFDGDGFVGPGDANLMRNQMLQGK